MMLFSAFGLTTKMLKGVHFMDCLLRIIWVTLAFWLAMGHCEHSVSMGSVLTQQSLKLMNTYYERPKGHGLSLELIPRSLLSHTVLNLSPQCSPWPDVAYQVNNAPSPSYNGSPNSFGLGEGYVQPSFPWGPGIQWVRGSFFLIFFIFWSSFTPWPGIYLGFSVANWYSNCSHIYLFLTYTPCWGWNPGPGTC